MIKPSSLLKEYSLIYSGDPALTLPADPADRAHALALANETGNWAPLLNGDDQPTIFHVSPLTGSQFDWWCGECSRRKLIVSEGAVLALRLALMRIENFGTLKVERKREDGQWLATMDVIDALYAVGDVGRDIVIELGNSIIERAQAPLRPKS